MKHRPSAGIRLLSYALAAALLALAAHAAAARPAGRVTVSLVHLKTVDGVRLTGIFRRPAGKCGKAGVVMLHGYSGNFYSGIMDFLPQALAARGFATLAFNMRDHDRGPKRSRFEDNRHDIAAAVDAMARRGCDPIFLYGHSMGTNHALDYLAARKDARIRGVLLTAPPGNLFAWNVRMFGSQAARHVLQKARELVSKGHGSQWMLIDLGPLGKALYTANHVVSLRGPRSASDPYRNITRVSVPILIVSGLADRLADASVADRLRRSANPAAAVTVVKLPAAGHRFSAHRKKLADILSRWMSAHLKSSRARHIPKG